MIKLIVDFMALLSSAHFEETFLDSQSLSIQPDVPDHLDALEADFENTLAYSLGYDNSFAAVSLRSPLQFVSTAEDDKGLSSEYVSVGAFPFEKFSMLRCFQKDRRSYYKNLYALSIMFLLLIGSHESLVGIQTTINSNRGLATLAVENAFLVCAVITAPAVIWLLGIRNTMIMCCVLQVVYVASNYARQYYTLIPGAIIGGSSLGIIWVAASLYKSIMATNLASIAKAKPTVVIGRFGGVFYLLISISLMTGNLISSVLFIAKNEVNCGHNGTMIAPERNGNNSMSFPVCSCDIVSGIEDRTRYILVSIYAFFNILAITLLLLTVDNVPRLVTDSGTLRVRIVRYLKHSIISIVRVHFNTKAGLLIPVFMLEGLQAGYYIGTFTTVSYNIYLWGQKVLPIDLHITRIDYC